MTDAVKQAQMEKQLDAYLTQALTTADTKAFQHPYLIPGIVGEVGELFGQNAKAVWHGWDDAKLQKELISEYGDIAWMTAVLIHVEAEKHAGGIGDLVFSTRMSENPQHLLLMRASALHLYYVMNMDSYIATEAARIWAALEAMCHDITGAPFQVVLDANLAKLADRAARGVLKGAGDNR